MKQDRIEKIVLEIYCELFKNAKPSADFKQMLKTGETRRLDFFMNYYLDIDEQVRIIKNILKKYNLSKYEKDSIQTTIHFGCSPSCKEPNEK